MQSENSDYHNIINYPQNVYSEQGQFYILTNKRKYDLEFFELKSNYSSERKNRQQLLKQLDQAINELKSKIELEERQKIKIQSHSENPDGFKNQKQEIEKQKTHKQVFMVHQSQSNRERTKIQSHSENPDGFKNQKQEIEKQKTHKQEFMVHHRKRTNNKNKQMGNQSNKTPQIKIKKKLKQNPNNQQTNPKQNQLLSPAFVENKNQTLSNPQKKNKQSNFSKQFQFRKNFNKDKYNKLKSGQGQGKQRKQIVTNVHMFFKKNLPNQKDPVNINDLINAKGRSIKQLKQYFGYSKTDQDYIELRRRATNFLTSSTYIQQIFTSEQKIDKLMMIKYSNQLQMFPQKPQEWKWNDQ